MHRQPDGPKGVLVDAFIAVGIVCVIMLTGLTLGGPWVGLTCLSFPVVLMVVVYLITGGDR